MPPATKPWDLHRRAPLPAGILAGATFIAVPACLGGALVQPEAFWPGYLIAVVFWAGVSLGCLGLAALHRLTGGRWGWGLGVGRELHAGLAALPAALLAAALLMIGARFVFPWADGSRIAAVLNEHQRSYLAPRAVLQRLFGYSGLWLAMAVWLRAGYVRSGRDGVTYPSPRISAILLACIWLSMTFAAIDSLMSLTPGWSSSMFGALQGMGFVVSGFAFAIVLRSASIRGHALSAPEINVTQDLGSLLMAFNLLWVYFSFSQYLIMWSGDLPYEVNWYADREAGWRKACGLALIIFHFVVPFALLLSRTLKRNPGRLAAVAALLLAAEFMHLGWIVLPAVSQSALSAAWGVAGLVAVGGVWLLAAGWAWRRLPIVVPAEEAALHVAHAQEAPV